LRRIHRFRGRKIPVSPKIIQNRQPQYGQDWQNESEQTFARADFHEMYDFLYCHG
jgi:hypothetical protein